MNRLREALERAGVREDPSPLEQGWGNDWATPIEDAPRARPPVVTVTAAEPPVDPAFDPGSRALRDEKIVTAPGADQVFVEQYRRLAAALHQAQVRQGIKSVMVTSAVASEGKTLTSLNLAMTLSHSYRRRVLLIDADLRSPSIHKLLELPQGAGLGDVLQRSDRHLPVTRLSRTLSIATAGAPMADPMGVLVSNAMRALLARAAADYDWVVVDTPPVAFLSDANLLSGMLDAAVLVVGAASTPYTLAQRAIDAVGSERVIGVVLNRTTPKDASAGYGYVYATGGSKLIARKDT